MNKKKILIILAVVLVGGGYEGYSMFGPKPVVPKVKIDGTIYVLPKGFTLNLTDGRYATMTVALVLGVGQADGSSAAGATTTPAGFGTLVEEPAIRDIITNTVTNESSQSLISASGREHLKKLILASIHSDTDVKVTGIFFTDVAIQ